MIGLIVLMIIALMAALALVAVCRLSSTTNMSDTWLWDIYL